MNKRQSIILLSACLLAVINLSAQIQHGSFKLINADNDTELLTFTESFIWNINIAGGLNVVAEPTNSYTHVRFTMSNGDTRQEGVAPYAAYGDMSGDYGNVSGSSSYFGWYPTVGNLSFTVEYLNNGTVMGTDSFTITFVSTGTTAAIDSFDATVEGSDGARLNWTVNDDFLFSNGRIVYSEGATYNPGSNLGLHDFLAGTKTLLVSNLDPGKTYTFAIDMNINSYASNSSSSPLSSFATVTIPSNSNGNNGAGYWTKSGTDIYYNDGNVGIGDSSPSAKLDVNGNIKATDHITVNKNGSYRIALNGSSHGYIYGRNDAVENKFLIHSSGVSWFNGGNVGIGTTNPEKLLEIRQADDPSTDSGLVVSELNNSQKIYLHLADNASGEYGYFDLGGSTVFRGNGQPSSISGNLSIGTTNHGGYQLAVKGKIRAEEVKVETGWADYVFEAGYDLPTLEEVEMHIKEKGHLINIPSAKEVAENGVQLGEMNKLLLEKIEELTLYILQQQKQIDNLNKIITDLTNE